VTVQGTIQEIAQGPFASQESIKELGTNGGGSYNANSAHPYENPTPLSNFVEMLTLLAIPVAFTYTFGRFAGNQRQGWTLFTAAMVILLLSVAVMYASEQKGNPILAKLGANEKLTATQAGGNMEGKEVRFGITDSILFATVTTDTSCGAVNNGHDSLTPLAGGMALLNMALGEVVFGVHRRPHGGPYARVPGQEDRGPRDEARLDRHTLLLRHGPGLRRPGGGGAGRQGRGPKRGPARPLRDPLRHHLADRQQR
jgi:K+-transporting ATPase A subunit